MGESRKSKGSENLENSRKMSAVDDVKVKIENCVCGEIHC